jgi:subtilisin family serine protease
MEMFVFGGASCSNGSKFNFNTTASSVPAQSDSGGGVLSVGAISASDTGINTIETYSSRGPTNNGALKPDVTAIDGVSITGSGGFSNPFFGTSAAAPHVAGLAALILDIEPSLLAGESGDDPTADRLALRAAIQNTAIDLGDSGVDQTFGWGRVDGLKAGQSLAVAPEPVPSLSWAGLAGLGLAFALAYGGLARRTRRTVGDGIVRS